MELNEDILDKNYVNFNVYEKNGIKYLRCSGYPKANMTMGTEYPAGTLPALYRPKRSITLYTNFDGLNVCRLLIETTGDITIKTYRDVKTTEPMNIYMSYV